MKFKFSCGTASLPRLKTKEEREAMQPAARGPLLPSCSLQRKRLASRVTPPPFWDLYGCAIQPVARVTRTVLQTRNEDTLARSVHCCPKTCLFLLLHDRLYTVHNMCMYTHTDCI